MFGFPSMVRFLVRCLVRPWLWLVLVPLAINIYVEGARLADRVPSLAPAGAKVTSSEAPSPSRSHSRSPTPRRAISGSRRSS
jgi:hypothetical protein